jgi:hypothetical protein
MRSRWPQALLVTLGLAACAPSRPPRRTGPPVTVEAVAAELEAMAGAAVPAHRETFRSILGDALASDLYVCLPRARELFFSPRAPPASRVVHAVMPHYGLFPGPMHYRVGHADGVWRVAMRVLVDAPSRDGTIELPDCSLRDALEGPVVCEGSPYASSTSLDPCPRTGRFEARATRRNVEVLLASWSREVERYWNRDAASFGLPVVYDFDFVASRDLPSPRPEADIDLPLWPTCGRTPYFTALRSGWSLPVLAHEVGHVLGLLDEYEALSGIVACYPKTPFPGAEVSRMGLSMRETTKLLPLHHYLVVRRAVCPEPEHRDPYAGAMR